MRRQFLIERTANDPTFSVQIKAFAKHAKAPLTLSMRFTEDLSRYGYIECDAQNVITQSREKNPRSASTAYRAGAA